MTWTSLDDGLNQNPLTRPTNLKDDTLALWIRLAVETANLMRYTSFDGTLTLDDARRCTNNTRTLRRRLDELTRLGILTQPDPDHYKVEQAPTLLTFHGGAALSAKRAAAGAKGGRRSGETRKAKNTSNTEATNKAKTQATSEANNEANTEANASHGDGSPFPDGPVTSVAEFEQRLDDDPFDIAWQQYPKHYGGPDKARAVWDDIVAGRDRTLPQCTGRQLLAAVTAYRRWTEDNQWQRVPGMARWLANGEYMDHLENLAKPRRGNNVNGIDDAWVDENIRALTPPGTLTDSALSSFWAQVKCSLDPETSARRAAEDIIRECRRKAERSLA